MPMVTFIVSHFRNDLYRNKSQIAKADWDCLENCYGCIFKVVDVFVGSCNEYKEGIQVIKRS